VKRLALILLTFLSVATCSSTSLPLIEDPAQLLHDIDALSAADNTGLIPPDQWAASIQKLKPTSVVKEQTGVYISIFIQTGVGTRGYVVAHKKPNNSANLVISDISYPNIYRFDFKP
jgi:hypothetical protein